MTSGSGLDDVLRELRFGAPAASSGAGRDRSERSQDNRFGFVIDFDSPQTWPDVAYDTAAPSARHDAPGRARSLAALDEAAETMARRVPAAWRLVDEQLQRVLLRSDAGVPGGSASHRLHVGACLLTNLHQPSEATLVAIEALTHEATHQLLYRMEEAHGHVCDLAPLPTYRSPWSGARLPLHSLVHASFVWFGLLALWAELGRQPASAGEATHARARVAHCLFGFAFLEDLLSSPVFASAKIDPQALAAMRGMSTAAGAATRAAEPFASLREVASARQQAGWMAAIASALG
ncbi:aKG-HExxH-type peptide beta-hydroxylase [Piscinibacter koreensis]|uniref:HEXXH motif domain-containing protein n=1 Tax=Piscinibacter koreensis TaxID=2742824 RepID=A0A7Y6TWZ8_9BURK|nr:HEXXH motif-containing putative peptide modification protein [Schlegelella koreensis]NUZ06679.1 hypothetical protein [Schlegelella koreensis]